MNNPSDKLTPMNLAKQMYRTQVAEFMAVFNHATDKPHGYYLIDLDQNTPQSFRLRTDIFPTERNGIYTLQSRKRTTH